mgnify:CR=1 FL=1|jgi:hypothetical protein
MRDERVDGVHDCLREALVALENRLVPSRVVEASAAAVLLGSARRLGRRDGRDVPWRDVPQGSTDCFGTGRVRSGLVNRTGAFVE